MADDLYYRVSISANGAGYDLSQDLSSMTLEEDCRRPDQLTINVSDPYKVFSHAFQEGMDVELDLGYVEDHSVVFRGRIHKVDGNFPEDGVPTVRLLAQDNSMRMGLRRRNRPWTETTLEGIVEDIASVYFTSIDVALRGNPEFSGNGIRQHEKTDLDFLAGLARDYGCEMYVQATDDDDTLHFTAQYIIMTSDPEVVLHHGRCDVPNRLISFQASSDIGQVQLPRVFSGIEYETGEPTEVATAPVEEAGDTEDPFFDENLTSFRERYPDQAANLEALLSSSESIREGLIEELGSEEREATPGFTTEADLTVRSENQFSTSIHGMRANGAAGGNHRMHAQTSVRISDVGGRFSGVWYLSQVRHIVNTQGYKTEFQCQR